MPIRFPISAAFAALFLLAGCGDADREARLAKAGPNPTLAKLLTVADPEVGARKFGRCAACHRDNPGAPDLGGPNLYGVYGKPMGTSSARFSYTAALRGAGGIWDDATLDAWIANPRAVVPGTNMQFAGMPDRLDRADIIAYLKSRAPGR